MTLYNCLFYCLLTWQRWVGFESETDGVRAFGAVLGITLFQCMNLFSFVPMPHEYGVALVPFSIICGLNFFIFYVNDRYIKIVRSYDAKEPALIYYVISILYLVITVLFFALTRGGNEFDLF